MQDPSGVISGVNRPKSPRIPLPRRGPDAHHDRTETDFRQRQQAAGQGHRPAHVAAPGHEREPGGRPRRAVQRSGDLRRGLRERPRRGYVHHPADLEPGQRQPDGAADHRRCAQTLLGGADHGRHPLFRLRPPGPPRQGPDPDLGQAGGQPDHPRRGRPDPDAGPARDADPGLLRHPGGQPLCRADLRARCAAHLPRPAGRPDGRLARRRRRGPRPGAGQADQRAPVDRRQAAREAGRSGRDDGDRRCEGQGLHHRRRHLRHRGHAVQGGRGADGRGRDRGPFLHHPRRALGPGGRADPQFGDEDAGDHRFHRADRSGEGHAQYPHRAHRADVRPGDPQHLERHLGFVAFRHGNPDADLRGLLLARLSLQEDGGASPPRPPLKGVFHPLEKPPRIFKEQR